MIEPGASFKENLGQLPSIDGIARVELRDSIGALVATIANEPGKQGSLAVYRYLAQTFGALDAAAASSAADLTRSRVGGVTTSAKVNWTFRIDDYTAAISPLGAIGPYLKKEHLEGALMSMVRIQKQSAVWPGVSFFEDTKATFRK